jgi:peroxiredoxin
VDDGAAAHVTGKLIPDLTLTSTRGSDVSLTEVAADDLVLYVFPKIGRPDSAPPVGWDETPGARGCTQQSCAFRDRQQQFAELGYSVVGLSAQGTDEQLEAAQRLHLAFPLLADPDRQLGEALKLPTFEIAGMSLYKRQTLIARGGRVVKVFYPVFPPDENAEEVLKWIRAEGALAAQ